MAILKDTHLKALKPGDAGKSISDGEGLSGKISKSGDGVSVAFTFRFRWLDKGKDFGCGAWPASTLADIRQTRNDARKLLRSGINPIEHREKERAEKLAQETKAIQEALTVRGLFDKWRESVLSTSRKDGGKEPERALEKDVFPVIGKRRALDISTADAVAILDGIKKRGALAAANKVFSNLSQMYEWGVKLKHVPVNPLAGYTKSDVGGADGERDRFLPVDELRIFPGAIENAGLADCVPPALYVLLGTLARSGELLRARKTCIDMQNRIWTIPVENSKNKKAHRIYLSDFVLPHMERLIELSGTSPWLMPDQRDPMKHVHGQTLINATSDRQLRFYDRKIEGRALNYAHTLEIGQEKWTPHDLRRTGATLLGEWDTPADVIDRVLNHVEHDKLRRTYIRAVKEEQLFAAWRMLGEKLQVLFSSNVVPLEFEKSA